MKRNLSTLNIILLFVITNVYSSCKGQSQSFMTPRSAQQDQTIPDTAALGDIVTELSPNIMIVYQDKKNNYWFGSWVDGLYRYDGKTIIRYTTNDGLCHNRIDQILEDKAGNMYFNTSGGINKFDGKSFTKLSMTSQSSTEWKLEPDDLWFKCNQDSGLVYRYDGTSLHRLIFPAIKMGDEFNAKYPRSQYPNMKSSPYDVYTIYKDSRGNVWFGTGVLGVCRYDGKSIDWISEEDVNEFHEGPANGVRSIIEDHEGKFWFSNSLYRYDVYQENVPGKSKTDNQDRSEFSYIREKSVGSLDGQEGGDIDEYMSAVKDKNGDLWIVMYGAGVWRYNGKKTIHYPVMEGSKVITLFSIYQDHKGNLWLGTHEEGVYKFNGKTFERFRP